MPVKGQFTPIAERIASKYTINPVNDCWEWQGAIATQGGYPIIGGYVDGKKVSPQYAYKVLWVEKFGPMPTEDCPDGSHRWELHHTCENKHCVNPDHLILVTHREHMALHKASRTLARAMARTMGYMNPAAFLPASVTALPAVQ